MTPQEQIIQGLQLQNSGLESSLDIIRGHYEALEERNKIVWAHADGVRASNNELKKNLRGHKYTIEQLQTKLKVLEASHTTQRKELLVCEASLRPKHSTAIHQPDETPSVRWVTYSNFLQAVNSLRNQIRKLEDQDDGQ